MFETLAALLFAHVLADYVFQTGWMVANKGKPLVLLLHTAIVIATAQVAIGSVMAWELLLLGGLHLGVDAIKTYALPDTATAYLTDQAAHLAVVAALAFYAPELWANGIWANQPALPAPVILHVMVASGGAIYAIRAGGFAVGKLMTPFADGFTSGGLPSGGTIIGVLERGLIYVLILAGQIASVGFLIAAKSVMRYEASKEQKAAEYVIIGTLASFLWAILVSYGSFALLGLLPPIEIGRALP
ncbi:DUF3307 domain-containing protein [Litorivita sp. NS0012-18]|uniref:DUF3307 domain-containing protein n=1 Tax=Litorivita sp. NS0012-18 TaxID=3127655 RepID=UPI0031081934